MARTETAKLADKRYKATKTNLAVIRFYPKDMELFEHLAAQGNKQGYIKHLIAEDMKSE